jgi:hypothetical protein
MLFCDETQFTLSVVSDSRNSSLWSQVNSQSNFQYRFSVCEGCSMLHNQKIGPFIFKGRLTGDMYLQFLDNELSDLLEVASLET